MSIQMSSTRPASYGPLTDVAHVPRGPARGTNAREFLSHLTADAKFGERAKGDMGDTNGWAFSGKPEKWRKNGGEKTFYSGASLTFDPRPIVYSHLGQKHTFRMREDVAINKNGSFGTVLFFRWAPAPGENGEPAIKEFVIKAPCVGAERVEAIAGHERDRVNQLMTTPGLQDIMAAAVVPGSTHFAADKRPLIALEKFNGSVKDLEHTCALDDAAKLAYAAFDDVRQIYNATRAASGRGLINVDLKPDNMLYSSTHDGRIFVVTVCDYGGFYEEGQRTVNENSRTWVNSSSTHPSRRVVHRGNYMLDVVDVSHFAFTAGTLMLDLWRTTTDQGSKDRFLVFNADQNLKADSWTQDVSALIEENGGNASPPAKTLLRTLLGLDGRRPQTMEEIRQSFETFFLAVGYHPPAPLGRPQHGEAEHRELDRDRRVGAGAGSEAELHPTAAQLLQRRRGHGDVGGRTGDGVHDERAEPHA